MTVDLPFDVFHTIIEMLRNDESPAFSTIQSVSQTCRALLPVCRQHLFSSIWLKFRIYGADVANLNHARFGNLEPTLHIGATNLANLVASSPEIAGYVREFIFYPHASNSSDETLLSLLQKFDRLEQLHFRHLHDQEPWTRYEDWDALGDSLQLAMENLVHQQRRTLTHLFFTDYIDIPISILHPLTCLHTFYLFDSKMSANVIEDPLAVSLPHPLQLKAFGFTAGYSAVQSLFKGVQRSNGLSFLDLSQLRILTATMSSTSTVDEGVFIARLLPGMRQLKKLDIYVRLSPQAIPPNFPVIFNSICPEASAHLETLQFQFWYNSADNSELPGAILQKTPSFPCLKELRMTFCIVLPIDRAPVIEDLNALDNLLCSAKFPCLESVFLYPYFVGMNYAVAGEDYDSQGWLDIPVLMPRSSANPALKFKFSH